MLQNIGIRKGSNQAEVSCSYCDVDNECLSTEIKPNINGLFLPDFVYKIECEGCGQDVAFSVIEL